jgi:crotonobetainyl-CoA:carnitine CoA-transferase CaiB-like acyl-CoA transferase
VAGLPLEGVRVVEFGAYAAGPMVGKYLGNFGATVVHVESRTRPDGLRVNYPPFKDGRPHPDGAGWFAYCNDTKLGVTLDLKHPKARVLARRLVCWADVLIENYAPGVMERLGLGYEAVRAHNPRIVYLSSCNMGQTGPRAAQKGYGSQLTSQAGFTNLAGEPDGEPMLLFGPYIDFIAVGFGLVAVLAGLDYQRRTGKGVYIDLSQYEAGLQFLLPWLLDYETNRRLPRRAGNRSADAAPHGVYPCRGFDRWCAVAVCTDAQWEALCRVAGHPEWATDPRFATLRARQQHEAELDDLLAAWTRRWEAEELAGALQAAGVPAAPVQRASDLFADPQLAHRNTWRCLEHPVLGRFHYLAPPFVLSHSPARVVRSPLLGEHNRWLWREVLELSEEEASELEREGVFR